jgi:hypothetical protein
MAQDALKGKVVVFAAGGCGINIASNLLKYETEKIEGLADLDIVFLDTSHANLDRKQKHDKTYVVDGLDGSGKIRAENHKQIGECILDILQTFKPGDLNIVLSSGSGGSGSVIAPSLVQELLQRNIPVVVITVGSTDSRIELENTIKTLKSYDAIAQIRKAPVNSMYFQNSKESPRRDNDANICMNIIALLALFSKQNKELDSSDLHNWLFYNRVTSYDPHLSHLDFYWGDVKIAKPKSVITVATLLNDGEDTSTSANVEYQCVGYTTKEMMTFLKAESPLHVAIVDGVFTIIVKELNKALSEFDEEKKARLIHTGITSEKDRPTATGLVL